jgi:hypothetical protein
MGRIASVNRFGIVCEVDMKSMMLVGVLHVVRYLH